MTTHARPNFNLQAPPITPRSDTEARIASLAPWFHNIKLPTGEQTAPNHPLGDFPRFKWEEIKDHIPTDLSGRTALDIGCNAGFYSLELARRGAEVHAIEPDEHYLEQARWVAAQHGLASRIHYHALGIWDLADEHEGMPAAFDLVLFMGVFYHLRHPLLGLDIAAARTAGTMVFQTLTTADDEVADAPEDLPLEERERLSQPGWPRMSFIEHSFATDQTNWWVPNAACCEAMLRSAGLRVMSRPGHEIYICDKE
ncbi:MAG TPA: TIGR04290 family methyltransferase [Phycisphaerales bacterium]|nr:TIGR04290 family methyltransferase [Phycisphaerales bacterium]